MSNNGDGTFTAPTNYGAGVMPSSTVATGDVNHDGKVDVVVTNASSGTVSVLINTGTGTFAPSSSYSAIGARAAVLSDLNGDGRLDLAVAGALVTVFSGQGDGTFSPGVGYRPGVGTTGSLNALAVGDLNGDGKTDLVAVGPSSHDPTHLAGRSRL